MLKLLPSDAAEPEMDVTPPAPLAGWGPFRRRDMSRVLAFCGFVVLTVWTINYAADAGEVAQSFRENHQPVPLSRVLDPLLIAKACPVALATLLGSLVAFFALLRLKAAAAIERSILRALGSSVAAKESSHAGSWKWIAAGLAVVAAALAMLEWIEPCYFVQDDNFANVLPGILQGCRSMFHGEFPDFDPCQYMGMPNAGKGLFTLFYPPTVVSYAVARYVLGNENWTLEIFAAMHLLAGYVASYAAARMAGLRPALAFALGISFVLSGYILFVGRGWHAVLTLVLWLPLLFCSIEAWLNGRAGWRWLILSGLTIGGFYYNGFPQYWIYAMLFMAVAAIVAVGGGRIAARQLIWPAAAGLLGLALLMPTLVVQLEITRGMEERPANYGEGFERGLLATVAPYPLSQAQGFMPLRSNREKELETEWYFAGTILMAAGYVVLGVLLAYRCSPRWIALNPWTVVAALSLWLGLGSAGILWTVMGRLPIIRGVNHYPHRLLPFFVFFSLILGGWFIERLLRRASSRRWEHAIAIATALLMLYHVSLARNSFWCYGDRPYPQLPREIAMRVLPSENPLAGRYMWVGPWRSGQSGYAHLLPHSLPSAYGALAIGGYDPIIAGRPETLAQQARIDANPLAAARAYGVRWILAANPEHYRPERDYWQAAWKNDWSVGFMDPRSPSNAEKLLPAAQLRADCDDVRLYELENACPMAFDREKPMAALSMRFSGWGAEVDSPGSGMRNIVVNMAMRPWVAAFGGGHALSVTADDWGRVEVQVPEGVTQFKVFYQLSWLRGLLYGGGLLASTFAVMIVVRRTIALNVSMRPAF